MELLCPDCLGPLDIGGDDVARCTVHGGTYRVLFRRQLGVAPVAAPSAAVVSEAVAAVEAPGGLPPVIDDPAVRVAAAFGVSVPAAVMPPVMSDPSRPRFPGMHCVQHPSVPATQRCDTCGAYMCTTCDFALPGMMHVCPACAVSSNTKLSSSRKRSLIWSFALAIWGSVATVIFLLVAAAGVKTKMDEQVLGVLATIGILIPSIVGFALGLGAIDRRLKNPPTLWVATVWNGLILGLMLLLTVIGSFS